MNKSMMWGLVVIALLVGVFGGYYYEKMKMEGQLMMVQESMQKQIDSAKMMKKEDEEKEQTMMKSSSRVTMMANNAKIGGYVTGTNGMALYTYDKDTTGVSNCTGQCATVWPPYMVKDPVPSPLPDHITAIKRADGSMQYAWDGKPLYYYIKDKDKEDVYGDGVGGVWHVAK